MDIPFTVDQFFNVFRHYNETVFPMQIIFYMLGGAAIYLALKPDTGSKKIIPSILAFSWLWMGIAYHLVFFTTINTGAYLFGAAFILQGILFFMMGVLQDKISFGFRYDLYGMSGLILIIFALIIYPSLGYVLGHRYPSSPTFGLPCPTTIFTFGILLMTDKKCPVGILIIPLIWSVIGFTAAFHFGVLEDTGLIVAALLAVPLVLFRNKELSKGNVSLI